jgi:SAM-dependent methyltransferase
MPYAATIFLSSFLLFLVQPLVARLILPWFGGSAAVWTTCMLFFQALLLAGYAYAHAAVSRLAPRAVALLHTLLLAAAVLALPIAPTEAWKPQGGEEPISRILLLLAVAVGLPYFVLAATSPLLQVWYARARPQGNPYRLFAVSNLASLGALVGYPFVVEPHFASGEQVRAWSWLFGVFALACAALAWRTPVRSLPLRVEETESARPPGRGDYVLWLALSATGSVMLLAVTNHVTQNVAAIPLLWLAPLTLYLLSFIVVFEGKGLYRARLLWGLILAWLAGMAWLLVDADYRFDLEVQLGVFLPGLFLACLFCHGELYRARPAARHLTGFYLTISAGGALGGVLVAVVAPLAFDAYYELGIALVALALLAALRFASINRVARFASLAVLVGAAGCAAYDGLRFHDDVRVSQRGFFGVLRVKEYGEPGDYDHVRRLMHGAIMHGEQYMEPSRRGLITTYYHPKSGVGAALRAKGEGGPIRVGVIGLGAGTLAAHGRKGDLYRFYEIDPHVVRVARAEFTYLADSAARVEVALGDARLTLEREAPQALDVLAVDAFSGDAIPVHLITREALAIYLRHLKPDGIVAFHVSNRFLDLVPVLARLSRESGAHAVEIRDEPDDDEDAPRTQSDWVLVSRDRAALEHAQIGDRGAAEPEDRPGLRIWTDDYSNLIQILK